ncbi:MAG: SWIM zinc finger family protein [bacterium]|nr:SWIM zinc finger family protein [bacterium]MDE0239057.1 SWIM zinc finger family protein [bacterium]MDE0416969.1 SWIM zinc finger family protein [bacterium]
MSARSKTWWGTEFLEALEQIMDRGRLSRGRSYAGPHRLLAFDIRGGRITATVRGNTNPYFGITKEPRYRVSVQLEKVSKPAWKKVLSRLGHNANWITHLILGEVPPTIETAFEGSNVMLLPRTRKEIVSSCSCPDWANPCKHVAGVYFHVAALLDHDPFLLFELRGMARKTLMSAVSKSEFGAALGGDHAAREPDIREALEESRFPVIDETVEEAAPADMRDFWLGKTLTADALSSRPMPPVSVLPMRRAGDYPEFWHQDGSFLDVMSDVYTRIAKRVPDAAPRDAKTAPRTIE